MRRPMSPDLIALGDELEAAVARILGRRRARRQSVLNAVASLLIAVPFVFAVATADLSRTAAVTGGSIGDAAPTRLGVPATMGYSPHVSHIPDERIAYLREARTPDLLILPTILRPALR